MSWAIELSPFDVSIVHIVYDVVDVLVRLCPRCYRYLVRLIAEVNRFCTASARIKHRDTAFVQECTA